MDNPGHPYIGNATTWLTLLMVGTHFIHNVNVSLYPSMYWVCEALTRQYNMLSTYVTDIKICYCWNKHFFSLIIKNLILPY